jgi:sugar (pentulose or hexulose) kinase
MDYFSAMRYDPKIIDQLERQFNKADFFHDQLLKKDDIDFSFFDLSLFPSAEMAYHRFMQILIHHQAFSTGLVLKNTGVINIFVDGGFSKNDLFMNLLAKAFPAKSVFAAVIAQASAFGAAMTIHQHWNETPIPGNLITINKYD